MGQKETRKASMSPPKRLELDGITNEISEIPIEPAQCDLKKRAKRAGT